MRSKSFMQATNMRDLALARVLVSEVMLFYLIKLTALLALTFGLSAYGTLSFGLSVIGGSLTNWSELALIRMLRAVGVFCAAFCVYKIIVKLLRLPDRAVQMLHEVQDDAFLLADTFDNPRHSVFALVALIYAVFTGYHVAKLTIDFVCLSDKINAVDGIWAISSTFFFLAMLLVFYIIAPSSAHK